MEEENKYYTFSVIKRIWKNYASGSLKLLLIALFCNAIVALTTPALPELIRRVIDDIFVNSNRENVNHPTFDSNFDNAYKGDWHLRC